MNWTGGHLRQGKQAKNTVAVKQKAYFAKARAKAQGGHQDVPVRLSILQDTEADVTSPHIRKTPDEDKVGHGGPQYQSRRSFERLRDRNTSRLSLAHSDTSRLTVEPRGAFRAIHNPAAPKLI